MNKKSQNQQCNLQFETVSPATKLLEKRRKMYEVHEAFEAQKEEYKKQEEIFSRQEDAIRDRDLQMQDYLLKFCNFLSDNDAKKQRAERRYLEEKKATEQKEQEIQELTVQCQELMEHQNKLDRKLVALKKYEDYLETVTKAYPDQYTELSEILFRYQTLVNSNDNLQKMNREKNNQLDQLKQEMFSYEKSRNHQILQLSNEIKELTQKLEVKENEKIIYQQNVDNKTKQTSDKNLNLGRILLAIDNLYSRCNSDRVTKINHGIATQENDKDNKEKNKGKTQQQQQDQNNSEKNEEEDDSYQMKVQMACAKLKSMKLYMCDFKKVIEDCKARVKQNKLDKSKI